MPIPGATQDTEIFAKVRIGEKRKGYPASVDHFRSDAPEFAQAVGQNPQSLSVELVSFRSGLNWWVNKGGKTTLACYNDEGGDIAHRAVGYVDADDVQRGEPAGSGRLPITCRFRDCPHFGGEKKQCRPIGRLDFKLAGDPSGRVWRFETKGWNTIENLAVLEDASGTFKLSVAFESKGNKRFPVVSVEREESVEVNSPAEVDKAQALVELAARFEHAQSVGSEDAKKAALATYLDTTAHGWRRNEKLVARLKKIGVDQAVANLFKEGA
jgi:hypothetical protein